MKLRFFGVKIEISYIFICALTLFIGADRSGLFIPILISVTLHEIAHITVLLFFGCRIRAINLAVGTLGIAYDDALTKSQKILSLFAGPLANLLLAGIFILLKNTELWAINLILAIYNLLPVSNLDGGEIIRTFLEGIKSNTVISKILNISSAVLALSVVTLFIALFVRGMENYSILLFAIYLILPLLFKKTC